MKTVPPDVSVASILMSMAGGNAPNAEHSEYADSCSGNQSSTTMEKLKLEASAAVCDDEELAVINELLQKDRSACTQHELETIRRERNRLHAKKTRLRKKKILAEMEYVCIFI